MPLPNTIARAADGAFSTTQRDGRTIAYHTRGAGPRVLLMPSAGREASDFNELTAELISAGYRTIAIEAPGIGKTDGINDGATLYDLADDVMAALDADSANEPEATAAVIGHAFGNRVARAVASRQPDRIHGVVLIAAGPRDAIDETESEAMRHALDQNRPLAQRREDVRYEFFADGNPIPAYWLRGWHRETAIMQGKTSPNTPDENWLAGGNGPMLVVQAQADRIAPKSDTADVLETTYPDRVTVALIENAGHALLPERPAAIGKAVIDFLGSVKQA